MGNPRRVYIYPPLPDDDGPAANRLWPPGTAGLPGLPDDQSPPTSPNYPDGYFAQGGGLLGMLLRGMRQGQGQLGADSSSAAVGADGATDNGDAQGGLLGRLLALQAKQNPYQAFGENNGPKPSEPPDPNFRQVSRARIAVGPQGAVGSHQPASFLDQRNGETSQASASNAATPPIRLVSRSSSFSPDLQNPASPVNGISAQAGAIPRSLAQAAPQAGGGLLGAYGEKPLLPRINNAPTTKIAQVLSLGGGLPSAPVGPARLPQIPMSAIPYGWKLAGPMLRLFPEILSGMMRGGGDDHAFPQNQERQAQGGVLGGYGDKPALPFISDAPGIQSGVDGSKAVRRHKSPSIVPDQPASPESLDQETSSPEDSGSGGGKGSSVQTGGDGKQRCLDRWEGEYNRCDIFRLPTTNRYRDACRARANDRLRLCYRNGHSPDPDEPEEYDWKDIPHGPAGR